MNIRFPRSDRLRWFRRHLAGMLDRDPFARADNRTRHIREYDKFSGSLAKNPEAWGDFVCVDRTHLTTMDSPLVSMGGFPAA